MKRKSGRDASAPVLLSDVAQAAGVSMATASMALRDQSAIAQKTRDHVREIAEKIGFRPNIAASMLARQRQSGMLPNVPLAIIGMGTKDKYIFPATDFVRHFTQHAKQRGFIVEEPEPAAYPSAAKLLRVLYYRGVRGITLSHSFDTSQLTEKDVKPFSFLFHGQPSQSDSRFHRVSTEVFESTRFVWETMWKRGYRRIGAALFRHPQDISDDFSREAAVIACRQRYRAPHVPIFTGPFGTDNSFISWMRNTKPDAVIGFSVTQYYLLRDAGIRIPEDMGYAALHTFDSHPQVTGLMEDFDELARMTAMQLDVMIRNSETGFPARPHELLVAPVFHEGETLPPRKAFRKAKVDVKRQK